MKNKVLVILVAVIVLNGCTSQMKNEPSASLDSLMEQYYEDWIRLDPLWASRFGVNRHNDLLQNEITQDYRKQSLDFYNHYKENLSQIDRNLLSENDQISYDILLWECNIGIEKGRFNEHLMPVNQFQSLHIAISTMATGNSIQPFNTTADYDNWLSRLEVFIAWCDTAIVNMRKGMELGYTIPQSLVIKTIPQFDAFDDYPVEEHLYYMPINNIPADIPEEDKVRLTEEYKTIIGEGIIPAHHRIKEFLQVEYLPACRTSSGIDAIPDGVEYYNYLIKYYTTTELTADEIFALGQEEVERVGNEMELVKEQIGFEGSLQEFFEHLRTKEELMPFTEPEQVIENFNAIHERMKPALDKLFDKTPKIPFEVRRTEAFREATASASLMAGSIDGSRPAIFYVPIPDAESYNVLRDESLFLHEAIPGHYYQISIQQEDTILPEFRRILGYSGYAEGWALYAESLGKELGLYTDPYQYLGMLTSEIFRSARLVVDVGLHTRGWTREQAIQYMKDNVPRTEASIIAEVERYMAIPGQALSYKIGQLKILELRSEAEQELGDKFDIAQFHNQILKTGMVPLYILENNILQWIESVKETQS